MVTSEVSHSWDSDGLRAKRPEFDSRQGRDFSLPIAYIPALGPTEPSIPLVPMAVSSRVKWQGRQADHSPAI
jgi:hypothetical protein